MRLNSPFAKNLPLKADTFGIVYGPAAETYIAYPKDKSTHNAILLLTDVIGHGFINAQLIADQLAANGYLVVMPDLFHGDPVLLENKPEGFDLMEWLKGHQPERVEPVVDAVIKEMRGKMGVKRLGGVGYCFGAKYVVRNLREGRLDVGFVAHPSFVEADELKAIKGPLSIAAARKYLPLTPFRGPPSLARRYRRKY